MQAFSIPVELMSVARIASTSFEPRPSAVVKCRHPEGPGAVGLAEGVAATAAGRTLGGGLAVRPGGLTVAGGEAGGGPQVAAKRAKSGSSSASHRWVLDGGVIHMARCLSSVGRRWKEGQL